jgi:hypothetical protein
MVQEFPRHEHHDGFDVSDTDLGRYLHLFMKGPEIEEKTPTKQARKVRTVTLGRGTTRRSAAGATSTTSRRQRSAPAGSPADAQTTPTANSGFMDTSTSYGAAAASSPGSTSRYYPSSQRSPPSNAYDEEVSVDTGYEEVSVGDGPYDFGL